MLRRVYKRSPRIRAAARTVKDAATYHLVRAALAGARLGSFEGALVVADRLGDMAFYCLHGTRKLALEHLEIVFGAEMNAVQRRDVVRLGMRDFARSFLEMARNDEVSTRFADYVELTGWEEVRDSLARGGIVCSAHLGNWEVLAAYFAQAMHLRVAAVARQLGEPRLNRLLVDFRSRAGVETILRDSPSAGRQILHVLKNGGMLAMLIDQDTRVPSITVPFLGRPARTPVAPAVLAVRRNLPIIVAYCLRRPAGGLELVVHKPLWPNAALDRDLAIHDLLVRVNDLLGQAIREHPTQWPWWHRRWRRPPKPGLDPDAGIL